MLEDSLVYEPHYVEPRLVQKAKSCSCSLGTYKADIIVKIK